MYFMENIFEVLKKLIPHRICDTKIVVEGHQINLPTSLVRLYSAFTPQNTLFSFKYKLIPLLQLEQITAEDNFAVYFAIPFMHDTIDSYAYVIKKINKDSETVEDYSDDNNPPIISCHNDRKIGSGKIIAKKRGAIQLNDWIAHCLVYAQIYSMPNIVAVDSERTNAKESDNLWDILLPIESIQSRTRISENGRVLALNFFENAPEPYPTFSFVLAAKADLDLVKLEREIGVQFIWLKREGKLQIGIKQEAFVPEEREIFSIQLVLDFLSKFTGIDKTNCATNADLQATEKRVKMELPLPLKEFYLHLPKKFYNVDNSIRPLSKFKPMKDGKINFLEENQGVFYCVVKPGTPFIYQKLLDNGAKWEPIGIMDGYLVSEFFWVLASADDLGMELWEYPNFDAKMLDKGGKLSPYFSDIADTTQKISEGNFMRLYQVCDGKAIALCEKTTPRLYLLAKTPEDLDEILPKFGLSKEK